MAGSASPGGNAGHDLRFAIDVGNFDDLPTHSSGPRGPLPTLYAAVAEAGYSAVQKGNPELCREFGLELLGAGTVPTPYQAEEFAQEWKSKGAVLATCIAGYGYEDDRETDALATALLTASRNWDLPIFVETHRASMTQDAWRTAALLKRHPDLQFTLDFSHWFTGQEMSYGNTAERLNYLEPIFRRSKLLHGRIGNRCCMQVSLADELTGAVPIFTAAWKQVMRFAQEQLTACTLYFCAELLGTPYQYAREFTRDGRRYEETDRWTEALALRRIAESCWFSSAPDESTYAGCSSNL